MGPLQDTVVKGTVAGGFVDVETCVRTLGSRQGREGSVAIIHCEWGRTE